MSDADGEELKQRYDGRVSVGDWLRCPECGNEDVDSNLHVEGRLNLQTVGCPECEAGGIVIDD
ncbi:hypothetical protein [Halomarina rubra]|uniref:Small CPxCG-related zinc finger protein n=1 Tax=Halomarina rubra TaxID=2071873 RepID=A0ABD6B0K3_9EURY|nr:hypothetical protein [Halomarina rubra]